MVRGTRSSGSERYDRPDDVRGSREVIGSVKRGTFFLYHGKRAPLRGFPCSRRGESARAVSVICVCFFCARPNRRVVSLPPSGRKGCVPTRFAGRLWRGARRGFFMGSWRRDTRGGWGNVNLHSRVSGPVVKLHLPRPLLTRRPSTPTTALQGQTCRPHLWARVDSSGEIYRS